MSTSSMNRRDFLWRTSLFAFSSFALLERIMSAYFEVVGDMGKVDLNVVGFSPTVDGNILPQHPFHPAASPVSADVPVMIGCTRTEWTGLVNNDTAAFHLDEDGMQERVKELLDDKSMGMIDLYRKIIPNATPSDIFFLIASDYNYGAPTMKIAERRAVLGKGPVFTAKDRATMIIDNTSKVVSDPLREQRIAMFSALNLT